MKKGIIRDILLTIFTFAAVLWAIVSFTTYLETPKDFDTPALVITQVNNSEPKSDFLAYGSYEPSSTSSAVWVKQSFKDTNGVLAYDIVSPLGSYVHPKSDDSELDIGPVDSVDIQVEMIPRQYPSTIEDLVNYIGTGLDDYSGTQVDFGTFRGVPAAIVHGSSHRLRDGSMYMEIYAGKRLITIRTDHLEDCYFLPENETIFTEYGVYDIKDCSDYHKTFAPIAEKVLNSIVIYDENGNVLTNSDRFTLYTPTSG